MTTTTIAVLGGKGGVGKTTVAVNLAVALAERGYAVGLVDGDVGGPDAMRLLGLRRRTAATSISLWEPKGRGPIAPIEQYRVQTVSPHLLVGEDQPLLLSGGFLRLLLGRLLAPAWSPAPDVVVVDASPGTGEVTQTILSLSQPDGALVVTTGGPLSALDNRKLVALLDQADVPVWAVIDNLRSLECPHCGGEVALHGGAEWSPERRSGPPIGRVNVPFDLAARQAEDDGVPAYLVPGSSRFRPALDALADHVVATIAR